MQAVARKELGCAVPASAKKSRQQGLGTRRLEIFCVWFVHFGHFYFQVRDVASSSKEV